MASGAAVTMLQITEDTPPDMLAGAMDLTVHLPTRRAVKMSVERSTPMMDLLVQITTNHHLQLSNYTLQALGMAPSSEHSDKILPYKPNTPIGTLDTQHIKVIPKSRSLPVPKNVPPGHQPFESTFRLKVHLPRNQLYVTRVSRNVLLEDIMKKVCEEKNLDPIKYEFKHPGNLDEVLNPKLTLSDYQITEIYVVLKGTVSLNQAFSTSDIMALRKEEERKQMHTKTGGGVFNLIFRRGKSSMGSGSISSDTRSISPTHSDDSRSVTPPALQPPITTPQKKENPPERPKPPQRKRRPAPKPPQKTEDTRKISVEKPPSNISNISENDNEVNELQSRKVENGLTICHSRNSSDSSGYHEASVLSENCNTSLPRRPKSAFVTGGDLEKISKLHSQSTTNLSMMASQSKSTASLGIAGRKKKAAPPPPTAITASNSVVHVENPSPVVASQASTTQDLRATDQEILVAPDISPVPLPRSKVRAPPKPRPRSEIITSPISSQKLEGQVKDKLEEKLEEKSKERPEEKLEVKIGEHKEHRESKTEDRINSTKIDNEGVIEKVISEDLGDLVELRKKVEPNRNNENSEKSISTTDDINSETFENTVPNQNYSPVNNDDIAKSNFDKKSYKKNLEQLDRTISTRKNQGTNLTNLTISMTKSMPDISQIQRTTHENIFASTEFLCKTKPPEVIAFIPKASERKTSSKFDSFGKKRFQIGVSLVKNFDAETASIQSRQSSDGKSDSISTRNSVNSALEAFNFVDEFSDLDENVFSGPTSVNSTYREDVYNQLYGMHNLEDIKIDKNQSISSLRSLQSVPSFLGGGLRKWSNIEDLDDISLSSLGHKNKWVVGDTSDTESIISTNILQPANDSPALTTSSEINNLTPEITNIDEKIFNSTDSGIAQETLIEKHIESEDVRPFTPPPPPVIQEEPKVQEHLSTPIEIETNNIEEIPPPLSEPEVKTKSEIVKLPLEVEDLLEANPEAPLISKLEVTKDPKEPEANEIDWQYQLPSPPKAFRDSSPSHLSDAANSETRSVTDFKDSVVTSPELFEKLKAIEDCQSEKETVISDLTSVASEEEKPLLNTLSLEHLEKRKSLVYNRELATSLKMTDTVNTKPPKPETFSSSLSQFESTFAEVRKSSITREVTASKYSQKTNISNTLPNFKISTYDCPKQKIKVFEDDTIRSNTDNFNNTNTSIETDKFCAPNMSRSYLGRSMENISVRKNSLDNQSSHSTGEKEYNFYKPKGTPIQKNFGPMTNVYRSESLSRENYWVPSKPVSRSKSHVTLNTNKFREDKYSLLKEENMSRSNSLYDVSGLQSLEVMKLIQNKLSTPTSSLENINQKETYQKSYNKPEIKQDIPLKSEPVEQIGKLSTSERVYRYSGPPSVNMGTWSDRPKRPVNLKEDSDYKLSNHNISSKLIVNTTNNNITSNNTIEVRNGTHGNSNISTIPPTNTGAKITVNGYGHKDPSNISIKVNGIEPISSNQNSNNVVIKIGSMNENQRFISHTTAAGYRKPFSNINKNQPTQRPHSIAFESDFDISRVPVVRSVELKKPYKDLGSNTSVTQIYQGNNNFRSHTLNRNEPVSELKNKFSGLYRSTDTLSHNTNYLNQQNNESEKETKPVFRIKNFKPSGAAPVVRGFNSTNTDHIIQNRLSWNPPASHNTLPARPMEKNNFTTNKHVPFSQSNLRRTDSNKGMDRNLYNLEKTKIPVELNNEKNTTFNSLPSITKPDIIKPPPPPQMPKLNVRKSSPRSTETNSDPRDQLLDAIRKFGGKKGLKSVKA